MYKFRIHSAFFYHSQSGYSGFDLLDSHLYEVAVSQPDDADLTIQPGRLLHLGEFRLLPANQPEMIKRTSTEIERAINNSPGLISATFHRSFDGTRMFNYGQWESQKAFEAILKQPGFDPNKSYWEGLARNEFHLYKVVHVEAKQH